MSASEHSVPIHSPTSLANAGSVQIHLESVLEKLNLSTTRRRNATYSAQVDSVEAVCWQAVAHAGGAAWDSTPGMSTDEVASANPTTVERRTMMLERGGAIAFAQSIYKVIQGLVPGDQVSESCNRSQACVECPHRFGPFGAGTSPAAGIFMEGRSGQSACQIACQCAACRGARLLIALSIAS